MDNSLEKVDSMYRTALFENYGKRCAELDPEFEAKLPWFHNYARSAYKAHLEQRDRSDQVLDIGCSRGYLLVVLQSWGFNNLTGIDLSPVDIAQAKKLTSDISFELGDAFEYLNISPNTFDIIIAKAVLEHIEKKQVFTFIEKCHDALKPGGILLIDVPNMDWLFASHERYMDFTHEVGFTIVSLKQVMQEFFPKATTQPIYHTNFQNPSLPLYKKIKRKTTCFFARKILNTLFNWADPEGCGVANPLWDRSILGVGHKS